jgi:hypothetical protein
LLLLRLATSIEARRYDEQNELKKKMEKEKA